ncbi:DUF6036 family nucleotidyltransferase [Marinimicrobium sp. C6131]|uniref:DUF6036 family nucleotidyltransferase n=1 Tax=Marinimicrobium sp. C6131 TaxID=3022676 RepID=UPI00223DD019|nr:DUF6036 family nucleotidyltransferase [Marinimicrobium sp. C6131]UZJ45350.1 DUF6036 family nucleotidyltransferase [Marinimicrobium sp. C6131]
MSIDPRKYPTIQPNTALGRALVAFFDVLEPVFAQGDKGVFQAIVFGGCAVHIHTQSRGSADVDAELVSHGYADVSDIVALLDEEAYVFEDEEGVSQMLELDTSFNTTLGPLHEDYETRITRLVTQSSVPNVEVYVASAVDVAISKLGRFGDRDQKDIQALLRLPRVDIEEFERLAREAISYYVGDQVRLRGNLSAVLGDYSGSEDST